MGVPEGLDKTIKMNTGESDISDDAYQSDMWEEVLYCPLFDNTVEDLQGLTVRGIPVTQLT